MYVHPSKYNEQQQRRTRSLGRGGVGAAGNSNSNNSSTAAAATTVRAIRPQLLPKLAHQGDGSVGEDSAQRAKKTKKLKDSAATVVVSSPLVVPTSGNVNTVTTKRFQEMSSLFSSSATPPSSSTTKDAFHGGNNKPSPQQRKLSLVENEEQGEYDGNGNSGNTLLLEDQQRQPSFSQCLSAVRQHQQQHSSQQEETNELQQAEDDEAVGDEEVIPSLNSEHLVQLDAEGGEVGKEGALNGSDDEESETRATSSATTSDSDSSSFSDSSDSSTEKRRMRRNKRRRRKRERKAKAEAQEAGREREKEHQQQLLQQQEQPQEQLRQNTGILTMVQRLKDADADASKKKQRGMLQLWERRQWSRRMLESNASALGSGGKKKEKTNAIANEEDRVEGARSQSVSLPALPPILSGPDRARLLLRRAFAQGEAVAPSRATGATSIVPHATNRSAGATADEMDEARRPGEEEGGGEERRDEREERCAATLKSRVRGRKLAAEMGYGTYERRLLDAGLVRMTKQSRKRDLAAEAEGRAQLVLQQQRLSDASLSSAALGGGDVDVLPPSLGHFLSTTDAEEQLQHEHHHHHQRKGSRRRSTVVDVVDAEGAAGDDPVHSHHHPHHHLGGASSAATSAGMSHRSSCASSAFGLMPPGDNDEGSDGDESVSTTITLHGNEHFQNLVMLFEIPPLDLTKCLANDETGSGGDAHDDAQARTNEKEKKKGEGSDDDEIPPLSPIPSMILARRGDDFIDQSSKDVIELRYAIGKARKLYDEFHEASDRDGSDMGSGVFTSTVSRRQSMLMFARRKKASGGVLSCVSLPQDSVDEAFGSFMNPILAKLERDHARASLVQLFCRDLVCALATVSDDISLLAKGSISRLRFDSGVFGSGGAASPKTVVLDDSLPLERTVHFATSATSEESQHAATSHSQPFSRQHSLGRRQSMVPNLFHHHRHREQDEAEQLPVPAVLRSAVCSNTAAIILSVGVPLGTHSSGSGSGDTSAAFGSFSFCASSPSHSHRHHPGTTATHFGGG